MLFEWHPVYDLLMIFSPGPVLHSVAVKDQQLDKGDCCRWGERAAVFHGDWRQAQGASGGLPVCQGHSTKKTLFQIAT